MRCRFAPFQQSALPLRVKRQLEWTDLRKLQHDAETRLVVTKGNRIWCWGPRAEVANAFGSNLTEVVERELPADITVPENLHVKGFLEDALATALAKDRPLLARTGRTGAFLIAGSACGRQDPPRADTPGSAPAFGERRRLFAPITDEHPEVVDVSWAEAVHISIAQKHGATWLVIDPDIEIWPPRAREIAQDFLDERRKGRFNDKYNNLLDAWVKVLIGSGERRVDVSFRTFDDNDEAANPSFILGSQTAYSFRHVA